MKKIFTTLLGIAALFAAVPVSAEVVTVSSKSDFEKAFVTKSNDEVDTIFVKSSSSWLVPGNGFDMPAKGTFHVIGINDEETGAKSKLSIQFDMAVNEAGDKVSVFFENLDMMCTGGRSASSKYFVNAKDTLYHYMDTLAFIGCDIYDYNRALFRIEPNPKTGRADGTAALGEIQCFIMEKNIVRDGYNQNNPYPFLNLSMPITDMIIRDNLFYNMAYVNCLFAFVNMTDQDNKADMNFTLENNTIIARANNTFCIFGQYAGQMSNYQIHDNLFLYPNWKDDFNNLGIPDSVISAVPDTLDRLPGKPIAGIMYGAGDISHNVLHGFLPAANVLDSEGQGEWAVDQHDNYSMEDVDMTWSTFIDYKNHDFSYLGTEKIATAGYEGGPIGCTWLVKYYDHPCYLFVTSVTEGVTLEPTNGVYERGTEVTVTATGRPGAYFQYWTKGGQQISAANPYVFTIQDDTVNLVAVFEEKPVVTVNITLSAPDNVTMSIDPVQDDYFEGDSITVTFNTHYWADFDKWSDGVTEMNRGFRLTDDINLTAAFKKSDRIAVWDFCQITSGKKAIDNGVGANHFVNGDSAYIGSFHTAYYVDGLGYKDSATIMTRNNKFDGDIRICAVRETPAARFAANPDYNYAIINTTDYKDIKVTSFVGADAKAHKTQLLQYSLDGQAWETVASTVLDTIGEWYALDGSLPATADKQEKVYIRWIGDVTSAVVAHPDNLPKINEVAEFSCVAGIAVKGTKSVDKPANGYYVADGEKITHGMQITSVQDITMTYGTGTKDWKDGKANATISANTDGIFDALTDGNQDNPGSFSGLVPSSGTYYVFNPAKAGSLQIAVCLNKDKKFYVIEDSTALADYNGFTVTDKYYGTYTIDVKAGSTYYVYCSGSKLGFAGFIFNAATGLNNVQETAMSVYAQSGNLFVNLSAEAPVTVYNLLGQTVKSLEATQGENVISGLNAGIYLVRVADQLIKIKL